MNRPDIKRKPKRSNPLEAQKRLLDAVHPIERQSEAILLAEAVGRILAEDAVSTVNIPEYDKTFIDGYAFNAQETIGATVNNPSSFRVVGKLFPVDYSTTMELSCGEAVYVACGAPVPKGATATVKVEETRLRDDQIQLLREIKPGEGLIPVGDDVKKGALILKKRRALRPQDLGLLASIGFTKAEVFKKPTVAVLSGGDELIRQCKKNPDKIANNYALVVAGLTSELGASPRLMGIMPDSLDKVKEKIGDALADADIVVTIGGSSVGVKDFVPDAINLLGKPGIVAQGVLLRPGAVSGCGIVNGKPIIILPGHIGSCIAGFYLFVAPVIGMLSGLGEEGLLPRLAVELTETVDSGVQFRFLLLHLTRVKGKFLANPIEGGSSALTTIVKSNGYSIIPPHTVLAKGSEIQVTLFGKLELTAVSI